MYKTMVSWLFTYTRESLLPELTAYLGAGDDLIIVGASIFLYPFKTGIHLGQPVQKPMLSTDGLLAK